jgi:homoserine dehydrogenase
LWYTEPNPWDDLNWLDVARKLIILARYSWHKVDINDIEITPLINSKYSKFEWEEFLKAIEREDELFNQKVEAAREIWEVLRYVWEMKYKNNKVTFKVWLKSVPKNSDLWTLAWTSNISIIETDILRNPYPHVIKSRWAWLAVTAWSVRIWIAKMLPHNIISR